MNGRRGSAIVLSMLLLVLLSALGMFLVSVPVGTGESAARHQRAAVARNMALAGANAAIARLPSVSGGAPYVRRIPAATNVTGRYSVASRKAAGSSPAPGAGFEEFEIVSVGGVADLPDGEVRVTATVRLQPGLPGPRARILKWEETGPR